MPTSYRLGTPTTLATSTCCCTGTGTDGLGTGTNCCCPADFLPTTLNATITGCDGGTYPMTSGPDQWNSGSGQVCPELGTISTLLTFLCTDVLSPDPCTFVILLYDVAIGPYNGTLVSCVPFLWVSDSIDLTPFGCSCGSVVITVTE